MPAFWEYDGKQLLGTDPIKFAVIADNADPWGMGLKSFDGQTGYFSLMTNSQASKFAGLSGRNLPPVYISENGPVRTIVESLFIYNSSRLHLRYIIPSGKPDFDIEMTVYWMEKDKLLKWIIPAGFNMKCLSRSVCGINCSKTREDEQVMRDWIGINNLDEKKSFSICSEGAFGFDRIGNSLRISLLRAPAYSGHPVEGHPDIIWSDRAVKRMDQGVHSFRFRFIPGEKNELIDNSFNHSDLFNNPVISRIVYPSGKENFSFESIKISDNTINLQTIKPHDEESIIIRLLNPCKVSKRFMVTVPLMSAEAEIEMSPRELKTFIISKGSSQFSESDLLERVTK
jgi:alpha-mannosidase